MASAVKSTPSKPLIQISAQQSRYALDAVDSPNSKDLWIKDLSISIGQNELISRTSVHFEENHHYVLVGRNGEGKSTLLRAFADKRKCCAMRTLCVSGLALSTCVSGYASFFSG